MMQPASGDSMNSLNVADKNSIKVGSKYLARSFAVQERLRRIVLACNQHAYQKR